MRRGKSTSAVVQAPLGVELIVPVHNSTRPVARAVASVLRANSPSVRVTVVCHNVPEALIRDNLSAFVSDERLKFLNVYGPEHSAAVPRNAAISASHAEYLGFLDSDDEFETGSLDSWVDELVDRPDLLIGQFSSDGAGRIHAPAPRPGRFVGLDPVRDLLNYRTPPLGVLIHRRLLASTQCPGYRLGLRTGEDIALGLYLWNTATSIQYSRFSGGYRVHEDARDRITGVMLPPDEMFAAVRDSLRLPIIQRLPRRRRQAIAVKFVRTQIFGYLLGQKRRGTLTTDHLTAAAQTLDEIVGFARGSLGYLDWSELELVRALRRIDTDRFKAAISRAERTPSLRKVLTVNPFHTLAPESALGRERRSAHLSARFAS